MRTRVGTLTTVTLFAVAVALVAFVAGNGDGGGLVKLPVASTGANEAGDAAASTMADRSALIGPAYGGVQYRVVGDLPSLPSEAAAYRLGSTASTGDIARLAEALGLDGEVREVDGAWAVRDGDRELRVERYAGLPWYLGTVCEEPPAPDASVASDTAVTASGCEVATSSGSQSVEAVGVPVCEGPADACPPPDVAVAPPDVAVAPSAAAVPPSPRPVPTSAPCPPGAECADVSSPAYAGPTTAVTPCEPGTRCLVDPAVPVTTFPCPPEGCPAPTEPAPLPEPVPPPERPARPADFPSRADAERIARETFTRLGGGLDGFAMDDGWITWEARVETRVDGTAVMGQGSWLGIGGGGRIAHGGGFLADADKIGDYPLAGVETGLRRLNEDFGAGVRTMTAEARATDEGVATTVPSDEEMRALEERKLAGMEAAQGAGQSGSAAGIAGAAQAADLPSPVIVECADPNVPCEPPMRIPEPMLPPEKVVLDVTGVHLTLLHLDGVLVPAYVFELADGGESPPVPAVTDEWLDTAGGARPPKG